MIEKNILALLHHSPPYHGAALVGDEIVNLIKNEFKYYKFINLASSNDVQDIGFLSIKKTIKILVVFFSVLNSLFFKKVDIIYFTPSLNGFAIFRDFIYLLVFRLYSCLTSVRIICHIHMQPNFLLRNKVLFCVWRLFFVSFEMICLTETLKNDFVNIGHSKIHVVSNGLLFEGFTDALLVSKKTTANYKLLYLGHLLESKGFIRFVQLIELLPDYEFHIAGSTTDPKVSVLIKFLLNKYPRVKYHGYVTGKTKYELISSSSLLVLPSYSEAQPLTIIESFYCGTPVVATKVGGVPDMVDDSVGKCVDFEMFVDAIISVTNGDVKRYYDNCRTKYEINYQKNDFITKMVNVFSS